MANGRDIDLHLVDLRYARARLIETRAVERLAHSIEQYGQLLPCIVVADAERLVLLDGYRRIAALRRLGRDTVNAEQWSCDLAQGLLEVLTRSQSRPLAKISSCPRPASSSISLAPRDSSRRSPESSRIPRT